MDFDRLCLLEVLDVSSPISDRAFANSRTADTGNAGGLIFCLPLILGAAGVGDVRGWGFGVFLGLCGRGKFVILLCIQKTEKIHGIE